MREQFIPLMLAAGCVTCAPDAAGSAAERSGRVVLERGGASRQTLLDEPAVARYCERDTTLSVVAVGRSWSVAIALRTVWPPDSARPFTVEAALGALGTAAVAARPLNDSARTALQGRAGSVTALRSVPFAGRFDVQADADSLPIRLVGHFDALHVVRAACSE